MKKNLLIIISIMSMQHNISAQSKAGIDQYFSGSGPSWVTLVHLQTANNWYGEIRYNYEEKQAISIYAGRNFSGGTAIQYKFIPMIGLSASGFKGLSLAVNGELCWKQLYFSSEFQYSKGFIKKNPDFFFSWSELGFQITTHLFTGLTGQYTLQSGGGNFIPGIFAGLKFGDISFPFYLFISRVSGSFFVAGLNYEFNLKKNKRSINPKSTL